MNKLLIAFVFVAGCAAASKETRPEPAPTTLYQRLGGKDAVAAVVESFVGRVAADKRINKYFWNADVPNLKQMLCEQICAATGGPCTYTGKDMKTAHAGMNLSDDDFGALVEDLVGALKQYKVGAGEQHELLTTLASLKGQVVRQ
jgi:hemoglobin